MIEALPLPLAAPETSPGERAHIDLLRLFLAHYRVMLIALALVTVTVMLAWREHSPWPVRAAWCSAALVGYLCQGAVCHRLDRAASLSAAMPRWMPWLLASIAACSTLWALLPWLIADAAAPVLLFACLINMLICFCIANAPGTPGMLLSGLLPIALLDSVVLMRHESLHYAGPGFAVVIGLIVLYGLRGQAVLRASMELRHLAEDLTRDLRAHQLRLVEVEHERTLLLERERLTRDMHDGLGSTLVASLAAVERGEARPERLAAMLRDCVDDLRAVINSLEPIDHNLVTLLATLRYRLQHRLEATGVRLAWEMQDLPALPWLGATEALHVMRIVQEVLNNVVKHAQARHVHFSARAVGGTVEVRIVDDGIGFDRAYALPGRGLASLQQRATELGGTIEIDSRPGKGTAVCLRLPSARPVDEGERPSREGSTGATRTVLKVDPADVQSAHHVGNNLP